MPEYTYINTIHGYNPYTKYIARKTKVKDPLSADSAVSDLGLQWGAVAYEYESRTRVQYRIDEQSTYIHRE